MAHIREVRPHAVEVKFVVPSSLAGRIREWARRHLPADPHGSGPFNDQYCITSVYLDTSAGDVFYRQGSFARSKYRIRRYGDAPSVFLERKMRQPKVLAKRRTLTPLQEIGQLTANEIDTEWAGSWFHRRVIARKLQPACQVRYVRMARAIQNNGDMVRLTVDEDFAALPARVMKFSTDAGVPFLGGCAILELKYRGEAPALFKRLIEEFALNPQIASKYRLGIGALHPAGEQVEPFRAGVQAPHA